MFLALCVVQKLLEALAAVSQIKCNEMICAEARGKLPALLVLSRQLHRLQLRRLQLLLMAVANWQRILFNGRALLSASCDEIFEDFGSILFLSVPEAV